MNFDGADTIPLSLRQSTDLDIKAALNDLPTLYPNYVIYVNSFLSGSDKIIIVKFSPDLGNKNSGALSHRYFQLSIQNQSTNLIDLNNNSTIVKIFIFFLILTRIK